MPATLLRQGKVRDLYDLGDRLLLVASDRISAFDWVLPNEIPDKGRVLTQITAFWLNLLKEPNHLLSLEVAPHEVPAGVNPAWLAGRSMVVKKCEVVPIECVARGYLVGSGWREYQERGSVCGIELPANMQNCGRFAEPIFTPATKAESGHDENISFEKMISVTGAKTAEELRRRTLNVYQRGAEHAQKQGILIADTKFEWGICGGEILLIDEVLTPDSSRFWPANAYAPGKNQPSFDKQFVREYLESTPWDKNSPPPELPPQVVDRTREKYVEAFERITGGKFGW